MDDDIDQWQFFSDVAVVRILESARKHGVLDEDILHALRNPLRTFAARGDEHLLVVGTSRDGTPIEVIVVDDGDVRVIHAMRARPDYWP